MIQIKQFKQEKMKELSINLNKRISIYGRIKIENEIGETIYPYSLFKTLWAQITPQTGSLQKQQADTILSNVTHKITIRYQKDIKQDMYIMFKGHRFDIKYILNPYFKNEFLEIFVTEVTE